jgi:hypothetical protein
MVPYQSCNTGDVRRSHGGSTVGIILVVGDSGLDIDTRAGNLDLFIVLREACLVLVGINCSYRHDGIVRSRVTLCGIALESKWREETKRCN